MTKTLEEAAREYANKTVGDYNYMGYKYEAYMCGAEDTVKWLLSQPIANRMTEAEKDKFKEMYKIMSRKWRDEHLPAQEEMLLLDKIVMLESIFGKDFFKEKE